MKFFSSSEKQTFNFAKKISKDLAGGLVLGLTGNLGAGKTIFTKGLALGLGIKKNIISPTFVLMKIYPIKSRSIKPKIKFLVHIDAYRLKSAKNLAAIGATEYFKRPDALVVVEWADKIKKFLPEKTRIIKITINKTSRIIHY